MLRSIALQSGRVNCSVPWNEPPTSRVLNQTKRFVLRLSSQDKRDRNSALNIEGADDC